MLGAGDPHGEVQEAWLAKESVRDIYHIDDPRLAAEFTHQLAADLQDRSLPAEVNRLGRTIARWATQISNWHHSRVSNGPTEGLNNLIKRIKRTAFGFRNFATYRIRALLCTGKPNWRLLATITSPPISHDPSVFGGWRARFVCGNWDDQPSCEVNAGRFARPRPSGILPRSSRTRHTPFGLSPCSGSRFRQRCPLI